MADKLTRVWLALLGLVGLFVGTWATFFPRSFYNDFPGGGGHAWVAADGPYNEHLVRDVGALNLALAAVAAAALIVGGATLVRVAAVGWLVYSVPHLVFHLRHLHMLDKDVDKVLNVIALTGAVVVPTALLVVSARKAAGPSAEIDPGTPGTPGTEHPEAVKLD